MRLLGEGIHVLLYCFMVTLLIRLVADWVQMFARQWSPRGVTLVLLEGVYSVTDPPLRFLQRLIPPVRLGQVALDLGFLVLIICVYVLMALTEAFLL